MNAAIFAGTIALLTTPAFADHLTVYQGRSDHVIGSCHDRGSCREIVQNNPGRGESIVRDDGATIRSPGTNSRNIEKRREQNRRH